jgi:thiamine phosphate synthase YjbQ (UPF0047 family)
MPIYAPTGFLDVTNATLRGSKIVTTSNVGVANVNPLNTLSVGSNLQVEDTGSNVLTVLGNAAAAAMTLGVITLAPSYSLEIVSNIGNTVSNTVQFTNETTGFVSESNIEVGTGNLFVNTSTGLVSVGNALSVSGRADLTDLHASNLTVDGALYANASTGRVGINTTSPGDFNVDIHGSANVGALTATDVTVTGNLTVAGELTSIRSTTVNVDDPIIGLANNNTSDPAVLDIGFVMARPSTATGSNVAIIFDESSDTLEIGYTTGKHTDTTITIDDSALFHTNIHGNVAVSNLEVGQFSVVAAYGLDHVTNENNSTGDTIISTNGTTGLQTTANVSVGRDALVSGNVEVSKELTVSGNTVVSQELTVSGNTVVSQELTVSGNVEVSKELTVSGNVEVGTANLFVDTTTGNVGVGTTEPTESLDIVGNLNLQKVSNTASIKLNSNVVTEYTRSKKLIKYPRVAMTQNDESSTTGYVASASSETDSSRQAYKAFDNILYASWHEPVYTTNPYPNADGAYTGGTGTVYDTNGYEGEYLQIQLPEKIKLYSYSISNRPNSVLGGRQPKDAKIFASNDGSTWIDIHTHSDVGATYNTNGETRTFQLDNITETYYTYYRLVVNSIIEGGSTDTPNTSQWQLFGTPEYDPEAHGTDVIMRSVPNVPNTDWLEVYWDAGNTSSYSGSGSTTVTDLSGNGVTGTITGTNGFDSTYNAWVFDGSGDYISGTQGLGTGQPVHSQSVWFKRNGVTGIYQYINIIGTSSAGMHSGFIISNNGTLQTTSFGNDIGTIDTVEGQWYHAVLVHTGGDWTSSNTLTYVNGELATVTSETKSYTFNLTGTAVTLGNNASGTRPFDGSIANFRLFNRALSADEVWQLYAYQKEYFDVSPDVVTFKGGRLGIGTSEPRAVLDVRGDIHGGCPVYFQASLTTNFSAIPGGNLIIWDNLFEHKGGCYDTSTGLFTAPIDGLYQFGFQMRQRDSTYDRFWTYIEKNGSATSANGPGRVYGYALSGDVKYLSSTFILDLVVGDTIGVQLHEPANSDSQIASTYNGFYGYYIGNGTGASISY